MWNIIWVFDLLSVFLCCLSIGGLIFVLENVRVLIYLQA